MVKPSLRTKSIGTKVTEEEYAKLERDSEMLLFFLSSFLGGAISTRNFGLAPSADYLSLSSDFNFR